MSFLISREEGEKELGSFVRRATKLREMFHTTTPSTHFSISREGAKARRREDFLNFSRSQTPLPETKSRNGVAGASACPNRVWAREPSASSLLPSRLRAFAPSREKQSVSHRPKLGIFHLPSCAILATWLLTTAAQAQITFPQQPGSAAPTPTPPQLAPIAPPVPVFPYPMWMVGIAVAVAVLVLATIVWAIVRYIKNRPLPPPPTPRQRARAALENLRERIGQIEPYPFSVEVSDVLRSFVTDEFQVRATRQTSPEFLAAAASSPRFSEADKALLATFLEKADLIKFARLAASSADSEQLLEQAHRFVEGGRTE